MNEREKFEFLNSAPWIKYTHKRYLTLEEFKYRVDKNDPEKWKLLWPKIVNMRKGGAIPIFLYSLDQKFWYFPADAIHKKLSEIELLGTKLYEKIIGEKSFLENFRNDSETEEAITSAIYEGANSTRAKARELIASGKRPATKDDWMLLNSLEALNWIKKTQKEAVNLDFILKVHQIVTKNTLDDIDSRYCGKFRDDAVAINNSFGNIVHKGIPFDKIEACLSEIIKNITYHPRFIHPLIKGILFHYFIAYIHPFFDGNGRTARTIFYFKAMKYDLKFVELLSISAHLKNSGNQYEKAFENVKKHDWDLTYFIDYCLESLLYALKIVDGKVNYLLKINILKEYQDLNDIQINLLQRMSLNKYKKVDINDLVFDTQKSREFARQSLKKLVELDYLSEEKVSKKLVYKINAKKLKNTVLSLILKADTMSG